MDKPMIPNRILRVIKIKAASAYPIEHLPGVDWQKKCPQGFRTAGKSTKSGGDTWIRSADCGAVWDGRIMCVNSAMCSFIEQC
jgi:hypothetical protein